MTPAERIFFDVTSEFLELSAEGQTSGLLGTVLGRIEDLRSSFLHEHPEAIYARLIFLAAAACALAATGDTTTDATRRENGLGLFPIARNYLERQGGNLS